MTLTYFLFPLKYWVIGTLEYIWHGLQTGFIQIWNKLCKKLYYLDIKISFWKEKKGGVLSSIFTFSLCIIANDEKRRSNSWFTTQNIHSWHPAERFISFFCVLAFEQSEKVIKQCKKFMLRCRSHNVLPNCGVFEF